MKKIKPINIDKALFMKVHLKGNDDNKEFIFKAGSIFQAILLGASQRIREDKEFVFSMVMEYGESVLIGASEKLQDDLDFLLPIFKDHPKAIGFTSQRLIDEVGDNEPYQFFTAQKEAIALQAELQPKIEPRKKTYKI